ncbi:MAG: hypothetical protein FWC26_04630 [Fibromonadales bacterium]|nr:hypothetical protein [Fibromonadales bacterium]
MGKMQAMRDYAERKGISFWRVNHLIYYNKRLMFNEQGEIVPTLARLEYEQMVMDREKRGPKKTRYSILKRPEEYKEWITNRKRDKFGRWVSNKNANTLNNTNNLEPGENDYEQ